MLMFNWPCKLSHACILHTSAPTGLSWGSLHAAILPCQAPDPPSVLFHRATAFWIPAECSQLGYGCPGTARPSQLPACLMPAAAPLARCFTLTVPITRVNMNSDPILRQGWAIPIMCNLCWSRSREQLLRQILGRIWGILVMSKDLSSRSLQPEQGVSLKPPASSCLLFQSS